MKRIAMLLIAVSFLASCGLTFHDVMWSVGQTGGVQTASITFQIGSKTGGGMESIPWSEIEQYRDTDTTLYVNTMGLPLAVGQSLILTITVDGVVQNTLTVTGAGAPVSTQISAAISR